LEGLADKLVLNTLVETAPLLVNVIVREDPAARTIGLAELEGGLAASTGDSDAWAPVAASMTAPAAAKIAAARNRRALSRSMPTIATICAPANHGRTVSQAQDSSL